MFKKEKTSEYTMKLLEKENKKLLRENERLKKESAMENVKRLKDEYEVLVKDVKRIKEKYSEKLKEVTELEIRMKEKLLLLEIDIRSTNKEKENE